MRALVSVEHCWNLVPTESMEVAPGENSCGHTTVGPRGSGLVVCLGVVPFLAVRTVRVLNGRAQNGSWLPLRS